MEETSLDHGLGPQPLPPCPGPDSPGTPATARTAGRDAAQPGGSHLGPWQATRGARLTCDVLAPGVVQVRGQHVSHGKKEAQPNAAATRDCPRCSGRRRWRHGTQPALLQPLTLPWPRPLLRSRSGSVRPETASTPRPSPPPSSRAPPRPAPPGSSPGGQPPRPRPPPPLPRTLASSRRGRAGDGGTARETETKRRSEKGKCAA